MQIDGRALVKRTNQKPCRSNAAVARDLIGFRSENRVEPKKDLTFASIVVCVRRRVWIAIEDRRRRQCPYLRIHGPLISSHSLLEFQNFDLRLFAFGSFLGVFGVFRTRGNRHANPDTGTHPAKRRISEHALSLPCNANQWNGDHVLFSDRSLFRRPILTAYFGDTVGERSCFRISNGPCFPEYRLTEK